MANKHASHDEHHRDRRANPPESTGYVSDRGIAPRRAADVAVMHRAYVDGSPLALALVDEQTQAILYANLAFHHLGGTATELILGRKAADLVPSAGAQSIAELLRRVSASGEAVCDIGIDAVGAASNVAAWAVSVWPVSSRDERPGVLVMEVRNVTGQMRERRRRAAVADQMREINERLLLSTLHEEELKEKAEAANEAKSVFLATMSHELRTPLAAIIGYQELLASAITGPVTDAQRMQLARIKESAGHLLALIDQVLTLARMEADHEVVDARLVDVCDLVETVTTLITPLAAAKGLRFTVDTPGPGVTMDTDPLKVRQILINLLGNAVKFSERGKIGLTVRATDADATFAVSDSGIGIAPENLERIFDPFWQVQQKATRTVGGSGLGLSVARRLSRLLDGDLTVTSAVGVGSTFTLRLPLRLSPPPTASP